MKCRSAKRQASLIRLIVIFAVILLFVPKAMPAQSAASGSRIQLGGLDGKPLPSVVEIMGTGSSGGEGTGTGFLSKNCTVLTNIHVLEPGILADPSDENKPREFNGKTLDNTSFVGNEYAFRTQELGPDKKRLYSKIRILAHGNYNQEFKDARDANDWAIGEDLGCLSQKEKLGFFYVSRGSYDELVGQDIFSAGFSIKPGTAINGWILVVDSKCTIEADPRHDLWKTNCLLDHKGSGSVAGMKGPDPETENLLFAVGIFVSGIAESSYMIPFRALYTDSADFRRAIETERSPQKSP